MCVCMCECMCECVCVFAEMSHTWPYDLFDHLFAKGSGLGISSILALGAISCVTSVLGSIHPKYKEITADLQWRHNAVLAVEQMLTTCGGWQDQIGAGVFVTIRMVNIFDNPPPTAPFGIKYVSTPPSQIPLPFSVHPLTLSEVFPFLCFSNFNTRIECPQTSE